jgi:Protein of unknown function (DUF4242)
LLTPPAVPRLSAHQTTRLPEIGNSAYRRLDPRLLILSSVAARGRPRERKTLPRYLVERTFPQGLNIRITDDGINEVEAVIAADSTERVSRMQSYASDDKRNTCCIDDRPSPQAIRAAGPTHGLPVDGIAEVGVLHPYFES